MAASEACPLPSGPLACGTPLPKNDENRDLEHLQRAIELSELARARGDHPFGALLTDPHGRPLLEAMNSVVTTGDGTAHAERSLMSDASKRHDAAFLATCTMYSSAEPCAMCAGAAYWAGVGRVVYGLSESKLLELIGPDTQNLTMDLPCRAVFAAGQRPVEVVGPLLEEASARAHQGFWTPLNWKDGAADIAASEPSVPPGS